MRAFAGAPGSTAAKLALIWLWSAAAAYRVKRAGDVAEHRRRRVRNHAFTFAAVALRIEPGVRTNLFAVPFPKANLRVAWLAWVPNLIVAEWLGLRRAAAG